MRMYDRARVCVCMCVSVSASTRADWGSDGRPAGVQKEEVAAASFVLALLPASQAEWQTTTKGGAEW